MLALARTAGPAIAFEPLEGAMAIFNDTRLWSRRFGWIEDMQLGADVITDVFFLLYGGIFGSLAVQVSLLEGVQVAGPAAPQLEGANFTIGILTADVTIRVEGGWAHAVEPNT